MSRTILYGLLLIAIVPFTASAQTASSAPETSSVHSAHVVVPQSAVLPRPATGGVEITGVEAGVVVLEQVATTTMDVRLRNRDNRRVQAELLIPVPHGAVVRGFDFHGNSAEPTARLLPKSEARQTFDSIVRKLRDPALLEFVGYNLVRSSVFPIEPNGTQEVRITYEHVLDAVGDRVDYVLPRTESVDYHVPWKVSVKIKSKQPISTVYSPSHALDSRRASDNVVSVRLKESARTEPGPFRLSYLVDRGTMSASLFTYPNAKGDGGYFLLLAGLPAEPKSEGTGIRREVTLVLDRSGSMNGEKIEQAREAALQVIAGLNDGERFNIVTYNDSVSMFSPKPVEKQDATEKDARRYVNGINARGGTNLYDALTESLNPKPVNETLPIVLFLTDGLPTVGNTSEAEIGNLAAQYNQFDRRIFTFGVGVDVNTPLLEKIANSSRAKATFVLPNEDVETKVGDVFRGLDGPILADTRMEVLDADGEISTRRISEFLPSKLPDLFDGDQLVLLGRYHGSEPLTFRLGGNYMGEQKSFVFRFDLENATTRNTFVPRLWASRKIALLIDAIRQHGANGGLQMLVANPTDPKVKELTDEILKLTQEFGILTEYTAFLAREGTDLTRQDDVLQEAVNNFDVRAINTRSGYGSVNQSLNNQMQLVQGCVNPRNGFWDANMQRVAITTVQQVNDCAFFRRNGQWVDGRLLYNQNDAEEPRTIEFGSAEFDKLLGRLVKQNRQGTVSLTGDILLLVDGEQILVKAPKSTESTQEDASQNDAHDKESD